MVKTWCVQRRFSGLFCLLLTLLLALPSIGMSSSNAPPGTTSAYHYRTYLEMTTELQALAQKYPEIMSLQSIGKTYEGRDIWLVKLSRNVSVEEQEPSLLFMGAHHGNEKPGPAVCMFFINYMVENYTRPNTDDDHDGLLNEDPIDGVDNDHDGRIDEDPPEDLVRSVLNSTQIFLIPMVNPDGYEADTRKNCVPNHGPFGLSKTVTSYGVNLNRNYDDPWYLYYLLPTQYGCMFCLTDSSINYHGPRPFSENETRAVKAFAESHDLVVSISYHSYGQFILYPWMHTSKPVPDEATFISLGENMSHINGFTLDTGGHYRIPRYGGTLGTSENFLYRTCGAYAFTVELCTQRAPTNAQVMYATCLTQTGVHLYLCQRAASLPAAKIMSH